MLAATIEGEGHLPACASISLGPSMNPSVTRIEQCANEETRAGQDWNAMRIAILIPCKNEALTIRGIVASFRRVMPRAEVWVCDNGSSDQTASEARSAGAKVIEETRLGKGHAVWRLFATVDADIYVLIDGDGTYEIESATAMVDTLLAERLAMVVGQRVPRSDGSGPAYRRGHEWGNRLFTGTMSRLFGFHLFDVFSGFRVLSAGFVRSFPALSRGFEIETELTVHALDMGLAIREIPTPYGSRPEGSSSKLRTVRDGLRIAFTVAHLYEQIKPARFFGVIALILFATSLGLGIPVVLEYLRTGLVPRFPTAILASAVMLLAMLAAACGVILDSVGRGRREQKRLAYLGLRTGTAER
jgi:glycosyltransferase involved in cell wall biosynthesis